MFEGIYMIPFANDSKKMQPNFADTAVPCHHLLQLWSSLLMFLYIMGAIGPCLLWTVCRQRFKDSRKLERIDLGVRVPPFTGIVPGLFHESCTRVVISQVIMALVAGSSLGRNLRMKTSSWAFRSWHLVHGKCWANHKWFPTFYLHCQDWVAGWKT